MSRISTRADGSRPMVGGRALALMLRAMERAGVDVAAALAEAGLPDGALEDPDARLPVASVRPLWTLAEAQTGDAHLGLHMGESVTLEQLDVLGYLARSARDGWAAGSRVAEFARLFSDAWKLEFAQEGDLFLVRQRWRYGREDNRHVEEFLTVLMLNAGAELVREPIQPREVHFTHAPPADLSEHRRILKTKLRFGMEAAVIAFALEPSLPIPTADPVLAGILERLARQLLEELPPPPDDFVARVRRVVSEELAGGNPSAENVAERLGMSVRTLRRRLGESGMRYKLVLDDLRRELARRYLGEDRLEIGEVAHLLGFSEPSAFHRAFKRWTGRTPAEFRAGLD